ncbi:uncharacterized protein C8R40DRAFT_1069905 [Lentinula edodes]|uniref:uncharacterized protein n=1 Tax=Lentinula edodes TaxID=5353 RepID=UPI001E8EE885|nr:uncharacterized protein C8R40DRAFT_1069905 [Lentinula edodes]KAH7874518.1 hypothetical protein C8R40DRAFT_1069905 [Lentinula edodes]
MLSFTRIFLSPSSLSPALYYPLRFLFLFSLAFLINSVITFAEATPVPLGIPQPSRILQFERCSSAKTSGFLFRVGLYDSQGGKTTKFGQGVLVVCIGMNHCFGYTTTTTTAGGGGSIALGEGKTTTESLEMRTTDYPSRPTRLTAQSQDVISFQDSSDEIRKETGLKKRNGEDMDTFYFRVLLGYMAAKGIIGNYNRETYGNMMNALQLARAGKTNAAMLGASSSLPPSGGSGSTQQAPAHDTPDTNLQGGGAADYPPRISYHLVSSSIIRALFDVQPRALQVQTRNPSMVIAQRCTSLLFKKSSKRTCEKPKNSESKVGGKSRTPHSSICSISFYDLLLLLLSQPKVRLPTHQQPEQQLDLDHPIYPGNGVTGTAGVGSGVYTVEGVYTIDRVYTVEGVHTGVAIHESGGGGGGRTQTGSGRIGGMYCGVGVGLGRLFERRKTWGPPVAGAAGAAWATGAVGLSKGVGGGAGTAGAGASVFGSFDTPTQSKDPEKRNNSKTVLQGNSKRRSVVTPLLVLPVFPRGGAELFHIRKKRYRMVHSTVLSEVQRSKRQSQSSLDVKQRQSDSWKAFKFELSLEQG